MGTDKSEMRKNRRVATPDLSPAFLRPGTRMEYQIRRVATVEIHASLRGALKFVAIPGIEMPG